MTSFLEAKGWGFCVIFEKKAVGLDLKLDKVSWDLNLGESSWDYGVRARLLDQWVEIWHWTKRVDFWTWARPVQLGLRDAPRVVGSDGTVSIVKIVCLSLSSCWKHKSQEDNKSFVPAQRKSSVFRVCKRTSYIFFYVFVSWSYFGEYATLLVYLF